ncbi:MAG: putative transcriptional regulator containing domain [Acidobacteria bacterium]|nr:putative transcriptional regulator containing domain [Acidobacteriota bacterium]
MQLRSIVALLDCEVISGHAVLDIEVPSCFAADLMSDVLAFSTPDSLLITGLTSVQSVHTAHVADCSGILFVSGKRPSPEALQLARDNSVPLLATHHSMADSCGILRQHGLPAASKA